MRITPSSLWSISANSPARLTRWLVYVRKTTDLTLALTDNSVPWIDVTEYVREIPTIKSAIEFQLGTFSSDSVSLTVDNITWWKANIFNLTAGQYAEIKVQELLGLDDNSMATDVNYVFSGIIDPATLKATETADEYSLSAYTYDELGNRIAAATVNMTAQNGPHGMYLLRTNIEIVSTNVASYPMLRGPHKLTYNYNKGTVLNPRGSWISGTAYAVNDSTTYGTDLIGTNHDTTYVCIAAITGTTTPDQDSTHWAKAADYAPSLSLDGGLPIIIYATTNLTAGNAQDKTANDTQRVTVYADLPYIDPGKSLDEIFIMRVSGDALPALMWNFISAQVFLTKLYAAEGITNCNFDTLQLNSFDSTPRLSFLDRPPDDATLDSSQCQTMVDDGVGGLFIAVGTKVFQRNMTTSTYTLILDIGVAGNHINRIWRDATNNHLWIAYGADTTDTVTKLRVWDLTGAAWATTEATLTSSSIPSGIDVVDYNYGAGTLYGAFVGDASWGADFYTPSGGSLVKTNVIPTTGDHVVPLLTQANAGTVKITRSDGMALYLDEWTVNGSGVWVQTAGTTANTFNDDNGAVLGGAITYDFSHNVLWFFDSINALLWRWIPGGSINMAAASGCGYLYFDGTKILGNAFMQNAWTYFSISDGATIVTLDNLASMRIDRFGSPWAEISGAIYVLDYLGRLYQWNAVIAMGFADIDYSTLSLHDAIGQALTAYMLLGKLSSMKAANIYRRVDDSGNLIIGSNHFALNENNVADVQEGELLPKCDLVSITSNGITHTYDGTTFDVGQYSSDRVLSLSNDFIPANIIKDIAFYLWQFVKQDHTPLLLDVAAANSEYEIFDGAAVNLTTTKILKSATGLIVEQDIAQDGSMKLTVQF